MVRYGVDLVGAMQAGRWKTSAMVARYSARLLAKRGGMAQIADRRAVLIALKGLLARTNARSGDAPSSRLNHRQS
jgi:hypothetical protein